MGSKIYPASIKLTNDQRSNLFKLISTSIHAIIYYVVLFMLNVALDDDDSSF